MRNRTPSAVAVFGSRPAAPAAKADRFPLTDTGNAEYFAALNADRVRFDHPRGRWLVWHEHYWQPDADGEVSRLAKAAIRQRLDDAAKLDDDDARRKLIIHALKSESRGALDAMLALAQVERALADDGQRWDRDPWLLGTPNGVVDLRSGDLRPGRRDDRITMVTGVPFDPAATCPRWDQFLQEIFAGDHEVITFVQRAIGYSLTGATSEQAVFVQWGTGANGKGTFSKAIMSVLGAYAYNMPFSTVELHQRSAIPNDLAALMGRRFVVAAETNDGTRLNEARIKALTGGDPITARFLHAEFFTFQPVAKFWLSVNHKPIIRDDSYGFWRRMRLIPFTQRFPITPGLDADLRREAAGILAWAVRGSLDWQARGLQTPEAVTAATTDYERESDPLAAFLTEAIDADEHAEVGAADLFAHYTAWANRQHLSDRERLTATLFGRKVGERFASKLRSTGKVYLGIARRVL